MTITTSGKLNIKNRPIPEWLTYFIFIMPFFLAVLQDFIGLPSVIKYTIDVAWILVTALIFIREKITLSKNIIPFLIFVGIFIVYTVSVYIFHFQSVFYYLWGFRNNFRFYFAFIAFCIIFRESDAEFCLKFMDILFWINFAVTMVQYFVLGYQQDYLGGVFGVSRGCNSYSIIFFSIVLIKSVLMFMRREEKLLPCLSKCVAALVISAMAELKFFFVIFMIILLMSTLLTSFTWRKFLLILISAIIIMFAGYLLTDIFGDSNAITLERIIELATTESYSTQEDLSRASAIPTISSSIMTETSQRLFGLGLGNCDTSSFAICNTPFFMAHADLHYNWFSSAFLFLETGYVGLTIYLLFYVMCFVAAFNMSRKEGANTLFCCIAMIMSVVCVALTFYNSSLRTETAYMVFFVLALPFISSKVETQYKRRLNVHR